MVRVRFISIVIYGDDAYGLRGDPSEYQIWKTKVFRRLGRTQVPRWESSESLGDAMTSDSREAGRECVLGNESALSSLVSEAVETRNIHMRLYLAFILGATSSPTQRVLREVMAMAAAVVAQCLFPLPLGGTSRWNK